MATENGKTNSTNLNKATGRRDRPGATSVTPLSQPLAAKPVAWSGLSGLELMRFAVERTLAHWQGENLDGGKRVPGGFAETARNQKEIEALLRATLKDPLFASDPFGALKPEAPSPIEAPMALEFAPEPAAEAAEAVAA